MRFFILIFSLFYLEIVSMAFEMPDIQNSKISYDNIRVKRNPQDPIGAARDIMMQAVDIPATAIASAANTMSRATNTALGGRKRRNIQYKKVVGTLDLVSNAFKMPNMKYSQISYDNIRVKRNPQDPIGAARDIMVQAVDIPATAIASAANTMSRATNTALGGRKRRNVQYKKEVDTFDLVGYFQDSINDNHALKKRETEESFDDQQESIFSRLLYSINKLLAVIIASGSEFLSNLRSKMQFDQEE